MNVKNFCVIFCSPFYYNFAGWTFLYFILKGLSWPSLWFRWYLADNFCSELSQLNFWWGNIEQIKKSLLGVCDNCLCIWDCHTLIFLDRPFFVKLKLFPKIMVCSKLTHQFWRLHLLIPFSTWNFFPRETPFAMVIHVWLLQLLLQYKNSWIV